MEWNVYAVEGTRACKWDLKGGPHNPDIEFRKINSRQTDRHTPVTEDGIKLEL